MRVLCALMLCAFCYHCYEACTSLFGSCLRTFASWVLVVEDIRLLSLIVFKLASTALTLSSLCQHDSFVFRSRSSPSVNILGADCIGPR